MIADRWGATDAEVAAHYPCDDLIPHPVLQVWRAVDVAAPPGRVWPWVAQVRAAPYSYDWVDNLGRRSPRHLLGLPEPRVGEPFTRALGRPQGEIVSVQSGVQLTGRILGALMSYVLVPDGAGTRLRLKVVLAPSRIGRPLAPLVSVGDLVMARRSSD